MIIPIQSDEQWLQLRAKHIGASEVGALAGCSPWATAYSLYHVKKGNVVQPPVSNDVENGRDFEEPVAARYATENKLQLQKVRDYHECEEEPYLGATLDYYFLSYDGKKIAAEIKFVRSQSWRHYQWSPEDDYMPLHIEMQLVSQLMCTGWEEGRVVAFCDGEYYSFTRRRGEERVEKMVDTILSLVRDMKRRIAEGDEPDAFGQSDDLLIMGIIAPSNAEKPALDLTHDKEADMILHHLAQAQDAKRMAEKEIDKMKAAATQLYEKGTNETSVAATLVTQHYRLKRTTSQIAERTQTVKAHTKVLFSVKEREDKVQVEEPSNPIMAG